MVFYEHRCRTTPTDFLALVASEGNVLFIARAFANWVIESGLCCVYVGSFLTIVHACGCKPPFSVAICGKGGTSSMKETEGGMGSEQDDQKNVAALPSAGLGEPSYPAHHRG